MLVIIQSEQNHGAGKRTAPTKRVKVAEQGICRECAGEMVDGVCVDGGWRAAAKPGGAMISAERLTGSSMLTIWSSPGVAPQSRVRYVIPCAREIWPAPLTRESRILIL